MERCFADIECSVDCSVLCCIRLFRCSLPLLLGVLVVLLLDVTFVGRVLTLLPFSCCCAVRVVTFVDDRRSLFDLLLRLLFRLLYVRFPPVVVYLVVHLYPAFI